MKDNNENSSAINLDVTAKTLFIKQTKETPRVLLDANRNIIDIKGLAISSSENKIFNQIHSWINNNSEYLKRGINVNVAFEYFNTYCSKAILDLFKTVEGYSKSTGNVKVNWIHEGDDEDLIEAGEDYQAIVDVPFNIVAQENALEEDEMYYEDLLAQEKNKEIQPIIKDINEELLKYIAKHPEFLHKISSRKFEELIADIIKDFGFDVELTKITRDGGRDIVAYLKNSITDMLMFVECKHYSPERPVGVDILRQVVGVKELYKPNKSLIVTSSYFTKDAIKEKDLIAPQLDLKDHKDIKNWLQRYK